MKISIIITIFFLFSVSHVCRGQNEMQEFQEADSLAMVSRKKADNILAHLDTIQGAKLLYSLQDKEYYIITKSECGYKEVYLSADSLGIIKEVRFFDHLLIERKLLCKAFDFSNYHTKIVTSMPNAKFIRGEPSYFVVKDEVGKRFGEFSLSSLTLPIPLDSKLFGYLYNRITEEISADKK